MNLLKYLIGLAVAMVLMACGGGGGSPGTISGSGNPQALSVAAPSTVTVAPGAALSFAINGGQTPYAAVSDNSSITQVAIAQGSNLIIGGILEGTSKVQVRDAKSALVEIAVTVSAGPVVPLYTTAPATLSMAPSTAQSFSIGGGRAPYVVFSDKVSVATATVNGMVLGVNAIAVGVANLKISDALGATISVAVNVASSGVPLSISPTTASTFVNMPVEVIVTGGTPPYKLGGSIPAAVSVVQDTINPSKFIVTPLLVSSGLDITFLDSQNASAKFTLTGIAGQPTIRMSPNAVTVSETDTQPIILTVFGATGAVTAFSSDLGLLKATVSGNTITVDTGTRGSRCVAADTSVNINVVDSTGALATAVILLKDNGNTVDGTGALISKCPP